MLARKLAVAIAAAGLLAACATSPEKISTGLAMPSWTEVNCSSLDLQVELPGMPKFCTTGQDRGADWTATWESVNVTGNTVAVTIDLVRAGPRTYIERESVHDLLDGEPWFATSRNWHEPYKLGSYEIQKFHGVWPGSRAFWSCAGFAHHAGRVARSTGFRNRVVGAYCVPERQEVGEEMLRRLIDSIRF